MNSFLFLLSTKYHSTKSESNKPCPSYCKYYLKGIVVYLELTVHFLDKFMIGYYNVKYAYLYPDPQADLIIEWYANYLDPSGPDVFYVDPIIKTYESRFPPSPKQKTVEQFWFIS